MKMNLLFSMDAGYIPVFSRCFSSILRSAGADSYAVYILQSDLSEEDKENIRHLDLNSEFHFIDVDPSLFQGFPTSGRYPLQIYYRLAAPLLLPEDMERILYLDGDIIVINSLRDLYETDFEGNCLAACTHTSSLMNTVNQVRLGMETCVPYINSGVMLYNLPALRAHISLKDIETYAHTHDLVLFLPDQDILTALYGSKVKVLDTLKYNLGEKVIRQYNLDPTKANLSIEWIRANTSIVHYYGKAKPWKENYVGVLDVFYKELIHHKNLFLLSGTDETLLSKIGLQLLRSLEACILLDETWACCSNLDKDPALKQENLLFLLDRFFHEQRCRNILLLWHSNQQQLALLCGKLPLEYTSIRTIKIGMLPDEEQKQFDLILDPEQYSLQEMVRRIVQLARKTG